MAGPLEKTAVDVNVNAAAVRQDDPLQDESLRDEPLRVGGRTFTSRLFLGTGKYPSHEVMRAAHEASGTECVTVAVRRVNLDRREAGLSELVKLEVLGDKLTLLPDPIATLEATRALVKEGFIVLAYTCDDPIVAQRLEEAGAAAVMPLGSPIGSGQGINNPRNIRLIKSSVKVPVLVDAGVGTASDVSLAFEL